MDVYNQPSCKYNTYVNCEGTEQCDKCGWNPEVEARRKAKMRETGLVVTQKKE